jgi:hypothetical protein
MMRVPAAKMVRGEICRICHFCRLACPSAAIRRCICSDGCGSGSPLSGFCRPAPAVSRLAWRKDGLTCMSLAVLA